MKEETSKIISILKSRQFDNFVGLTEDQYFDAKREPYELNTDTQKRELAKDISSFANGAGGLIILGLATEKQPHVATDKITKVLPIASGAVNAASIQAIVDKWIFPSVGGLEIKFYPLVTNEEEGLFAIHVPRQSEDRKPFLINKTVEGQNAKATDIIFGYAQRNNDYTKNFTVHELHQLIRNGLSFTSSIDNRLSAIELLLNQGKVLQDRTVTIEQIENDTKELIENIELTNMSRLTICIQPENGDVDIANKLFLSSKEGVKEIVRTIEFRNYGWDIGDYDQMEMVEGRYLRGAATSRKGVNIYRDGTVIAVASLEKIFLSHASPDDIHKINPIALIEFVTNLAFFYRKLLEQTQFNPGYINTTIFLDNLLPAGDMPVRLAPGEADRGWHFESKSAPKNSGKIGPIKTYQRIDETDLDNTFNVGKIAYQWVKEIYSWYGIPIEKIPYTLPEVADEIDIGTFAKIALK